MAIARITTVTRSNKPYTCEKCKTELPKGSAYRWYKVGFRSRYKHIRCMESLCTPSRGELDSSNMSQVWDAQDEFENSLSAAESVSDIRQALDDYAAVLREVGEAYREAGTNPNTGVEFNMDSIERADTLESAADEVENIDLEDEPEDCDECDGSGVFTDDNGDTQDCETCDGTGKKDESEFVDEQREAARAAMEVDLP